MEKERNSFDKNENSARLLADDVTVEDVVPIVKNSRSLSNSLQHQKYDQSFETAVKDSAVSVIL